jgi:hypothetical protein
MMGPAERVQRAPAAAVVARDPPFGDLSTEAQARAHKVAAPVLSAAAAIASAISARERSDSASTNSSG